MLSTNIDANYFIKKTCPQVYLVANQNCFDMPFSTSWHYGNEIMTAAQNFTSDPTDARRMFLAACLDARLPVSSFESQPSNASEASVHVDIAKAGNNDASTVIVLCPGARLTDGLCASGLQTSLLRAGLQIELPTSIGLILVHTITPFEFRPVETKELIETNTISVRWEDTLLAAAEFRFNEKKENTETATPKETERQRWCRHVLSNIADDSLSQAKQLIFLDVQTGSGPYGEAEVISCQMPGSSSEQRARALFGAYAVAGEVELTNTLGPLAQGLSAALPNQEIISVVVEFGCYSLTTVLDGLLSRHERSIASGDRLDGFFYPETEEWRELIWEATADLLRLGFRSLEQDELGTRHNF